MADNELLKNADRTLFSGTYEGVEYTDGVPSEEIVMSQGVVPDPNILDDLTNPFIFPTNVADVQLRRYQPAGIRGSGCGGDSISNNV